MGSLVWLLIQPTSQSKLISGIWWKWDNMTNPVRRTQSNNVQIIKIIPSGGTLDSHHRNITKVTLGSLEDSGKRRRHSVISSQENISKNINLENEKKLEKMKTSILRMMETKDLATQENSTLRRYKSSVEKLKQENKRLKTEIESLTKRAAVMCEDEGRRQSPEGKENTGAPAETELAGKVSFYEEEIEQLKFKLSLLELEKRCEKCLNCDETICPPSIRPPGISLVNSAMLNSLTKELVFQLLLSNINSTINN